MNKLKIGGVPEHFNLPWRTRLARGLRDIAAEWQDFPGGTGVMAAALRAGELDAALLLCEGAVAAIGNGGGFKIASFYTDSPLLWGIHVPGSSSLRAAGDLVGHRYAISRLGSGSHLMAYVHARAQGWSTSDLEFVTVGDLAGARRALGAGEAEIFFWEKFMTKPLVDSGEFRRVGEFAAPWPAFVFCVAEHVPEDARRALMTLLSAVLEEAQRLRARADAAAVFGEPYGLAPEDVTAWLGATRFAHAPTLAMPALAAAASALAELALVPAGFDVTQAVMAA